MRNEARVISAIAAAVTLSSCSLTLPVQGQLEDGSETFAGEATGYLDRSGDLVITSNLGTRCSGDFVYTNNRRGEGVFICDDGRSGPFEFVSSGSRGSGTGRIGDDRFTFTFGE